MFNNILFLITAYSIGFIAPIAAVVFSIALLSSVDTFAAITMKFQFGIANGFNWLCFLQVNKSKCSYVLDMYFTILFLIVLLAEENVDH